MAQRKVKLIKAAIVASFFFCRFAKKKCIRLIRTIKKGSGTGVRAEIDEGQQDASITGN